MWFTKDYRRPSAERDQQRRGKRAMRRARAEAQQDRAEGDRCQHQVTVLYSWRDGTRVRVRGFGEASESSLPQPLTLSSRNALSPLRRASSWLHEELARTSLWSCTFFVPSR